MATYRYRANPMATSSPAMWSVLRLAVLGLVRVPFLQAAPLGTFAEDEGQPADDPSKWVYLGTAVALVLLGGAFAGLTIALMGQDEIYLQVIAQSGEKGEKRDANKVLRLLKRGKHWVLVTLLLSNVITNETLPIVLDRSLGGGWPAVLASTVLIVIFGEIAPQSVCVRYGLPIGAWMSPFVLGLMWILAPIAWPTSRLLDWLLGEDHGTTYKKAGLKTLVTLHKSLGPSPSERLNEDEVTIISAVLDLKDKPVGSIMTPMNDVFTLSADAVLDEEMVDVILSAGYSRIPIYAPDNPSNFVGMLLVKMLITYDPEDSSRVRDFALATLPETRRETSCLDIVNFFQEGKSHMVLVSDQPGESSGALGVVTLEDVIEELIGEEIIDESDVFVDVHKAVRRSLPAPRTRVPKGEVVTDGDQVNGHGDHDGVNKRSDSRDLRRSSEGDFKDTDSLRKASVGELAKSPKAAAFMMRRNNSLGRPGADTAPSQSDIRQHLKHLGPSNVASRPKQTRISAVKIKPGSEGGTDWDRPSRPPMQPHASAPLISKASPPTLDPSDITPGHAAKDGTHAVQTGYGTMNTAGPDTDQDDGVGGSPLATVPEAPAQEAASSSPQSQKKVVLEVRPPSTRSDRSDASESRDNVGSMSQSRSQSRKGGGGVRSGSLTENMVDLGGVKKLVLETTSSSDADEGLSSPHKEHLEGDPGKEHDETPKEAAGKKKRRKRGGKKNKKAGGGDADGESTPLLSG